ncbi:hypothetical protein DY926_07860 [Komagataeibacter melaceti]|uniref:Uncharacterized protein n=1 Tax=Komagataeibacter melaceti TaxID=2766577 RepID=A0A371Z143_9PROT|nr:hypothetical protein DY926_07860 [Komagataeibacter melaceti]
MTISAMSIISAQPVSAAGLVSRKWVMIRRVRHAIGRMKAPSPGRSPAGGSHAGSFTIARYRGYRFSGHEDDVPHHAAVQHVAPAA